MPTFKLGITLLLDVLICLLFLAASFFTTKSVYAAELGNRSLRLLNDGPSVSTSYVFSFTISDTSTVGSLSILFCTNSPLEDDSCTVPAGLSVLNSELSSQTGISDFTSYPLATNSLLLSRTPSLITAPTTVTLTFTNVSNPSAVGPYFARLETYSSNNETGPPVDFGGLAFSIASNVQVSSVVPPYLTFCSGVIISTFACTTANGNYIDFGNLSPNHTSQADSQLLVATNAAGGYMIQVYGTTMTSGNNVIPAITRDSFSRPGTSQFGINLRANTIPLIGQDPTGVGIGGPTPDYDVPNLYQFVNNDIIASSQGPDDLRKLTVSYIVNTSNTQPPGIYVSTLTYVCSGSF
jgi:hypothetical protein